MNPSPKKGGAIVMLEGMNIWWCITVAGMIIMFSAAIVFVANVEFIVTGKRKKDMKGDEGNFW